MQTRFIIVLACILGLSQAACSVRRVASNMTSKMFVNGSVVMESQEDPALAEQSFVSLINMLEVLRADNPKSKDLNLLLARSYGNYAYAFWEQDLLDLDADKHSAAYQLAYTRADHFYEKGRDYGLTLLRQDAAMDSALTSDLDTFNDALDQYGKNDVPLLYWTAFNWANWINLHKDSPIAVAALPKVEAMMARALVLEPDYYYGSIHQFFGAFYASRPQMLGGNPTKAKASFDKAIAVADGKFLMAKVVYAQYYAVAVQDRALYERLLQDVLVSDPAALPQARLANELAKIRAKTLLAKMGIYF